MSSGKLALQTIKFTSLLLFTLKTIKKLLLFVKKTPGLEMVPKMVSKQHGALRKIMQNAENIWTVLKS
jgi:hypothetical protein